MVVDASVLDPKQMKSFLKRCEEILKTVVVDLNYESKAGDFDYKTVLKSPKQSSELADRIIASYEKDVARDNLVEPLWNIALLSGIDRTSQLKC